MLPTRWNSSCTLSISVGQAVTLCTEFVLGHHGDSDTIEFMRRYLRLPEVVDRTGVSRSTIYKLMAQGKFPKSRRLTSRTVGWGDAEIAAWMDTRKAAPPEIGTHRRRR